MIHSKFFGRPNGAGAKPQQSTLGFNRQRTEKPADELKPSTATDVESEEDDVEIKDDGDVKESYESGNGEPQTNPTKVKIEGGLKGFQELAEQSELVDGHDAANHNGSFVLAFGPHYAIELTRRVPV